MCICMYVCMYAYMYICIYGAQVRQHLDRMLCPHTLEFERTVQGCITFIMYVMFTYVHHTSTPISHGA
jgi:hypothetical protein